MTVYEVKLTVADFPNLMPMGSTTIEAQLYKLSYCHWPDLRGKRVLDVGSWNGFYAITAFKCGASSVTCVDNNLNLQAIAKLNTAGLPVTYEHIDASEIHGAYDVVLLMGLLYHVVDPLRVLANARRVAPVAVVESHLDCRDVALPVARVYGLDGAGGDESNVWGFNLAGMENLFKRAGYMNVHYRCERDAFLDRHDIGRGAWVIS